ncbi:unnamed protein product, partial [Staurois parvus]
IGHFLASSCCSPHHHTVPRAPVPPSHTAARSILCHVRLCRLLTLLGSSFKPRPVYGFRILLPPPPPCAMCLCRLLTLLTASAF